MIGTETGVDLMDLEVREDSGRYLVEFDQNAVSPSTAVVVALETVSGSDPTEMGPLYDSVDPDALDAVLATDTCQGRAASVSFGVGGYRLTVFDDGVVDVDPPETGSLDDRAELGILE